MTLAIQPLTIHPPFLLSAVTELGQGSDAGRTIASELLNECTPILIENKSWGYRRIYLIIVISFYFDKIHAHVVKRNINNRWSILFQSKQFFTLVDQHLIFKLSPYRLVYNILELLFIL